jgi:DNA-binding transcriptional LysR family regulator
MDRLLNLEAFVQVVEQGSFSKAAERLGIAKSAVSRRVTELERNLQARLLNRTTRRLSVTETGRMFHQRAKRILADLAEAEQSVTSEQTTLRGRLKIATPLSFGLLHLQPLIADFLKQHAEIEIEMDLNDRQVDLVNEGLDLAIRIGQLQDSSLIARRIGIMRMIAVAAPEYLARKGVPSRPEQLSEFQGLRYTNVPRSEAWSFLHGSGPRIRPRVTDRLSANNGQILAAAAEQGLGIAILPTFVVHRALNEGRLVPILSDWELEQAGIYLVYPPGRQSTRRVRVFSDFIAGQLGDRPYWDEGIGD